MDILQEQKVIYAFKDYQRRKMACKILKKVRELAKAKRSMAEKQDMFAKQHKKMVKARYFNLVRSISTQKRQDREWELHSNDKAMEFRAMRLIQKAWSALQR